MSQSLPVHISREGLHSLEVPASFQAQGSFEIRLINHAEALHVHLHLDDPLSAVATLDAGNHYVEAETDRLVRVDVDTDSIDDEPHSGKLKVATAYGAKTRWIDIEVTEPEPEPETIQVDESLATPQPTEQPGGPILDTEQLPVFVVGGVAAMIAAVAAVFFQARIVTVGAVVVLVVVATALGLLFGSDGV